MTSSSAFFFALVVAVAFDAGTFAAAAVVESPKYNDSKPKDCRLIHMRFFIHDGFVVDCCTSNPLLINPGIIKIGCNMHSVPSPFLP